MNCKICNNPSSFFSNSLILHKYSIVYYKCNSCGFIQTEDPYWLKENYIEAINYSDVGLASRNIILSKVCKMAIFFFFNKTDKFLDYGGGYGLFVRLMRDSGIDFYWYDKYCSNIFARGFEANRNDKNYFELVTAFEVFEHMVNPLDEIEQMVKLSPNILFTTELIPPNNPKPGEWWYYGLDHGQHISFYSRKSLEILADQFHLNLYSDGKSIHLLTEKKILPFLFYLISKNKVSNVLSYFLWKTSLLENDHQEALITLEKSSKKN